MFLKHLLKYLVIYLHIFFDWKFEYSVPTQILGLGLSNNHLKIIVLKYILRYTSKQYECVLIAYEIRIYITKFEFEFLAFFRFKVFSFKF